MAQYNDYIDIFRQPSVHSTPFKSIDRGRVLDDPTYLTFKIEFGAWGSSLDSGLSSGYATPETVNVYNADYDNYPLGLFNNNDDVSAQLDSTTVTNFTTSDADSAFANTDQYSAVSWLFNRNEDRRAMYMSKFINGMLDLERYHPYVFSKISGVNELLKIDDKQGARLKEGTTIKIECLESLDLRVKTLMNLYRHAVWDDVYQRWAVPDILRQFKMIIYITEIRNFHRSSKSSSSAGGLASYLYSLFGIASSDDIVMSALENTSGVDSSGSLLATSDYQQDLSPILAIECAPCEFMVNDGIWEDSEYSSAMTGNEEKTTITVKVSNCKVYQKNDMIEKWGDLFVFDWQGSDFWGRLDAPDSSGFTGTSTDMISSWLKRDFVTNLYQAEPDSRMNSRDIMYSKMKSSVDAADLKFYYAVSDAISWAVRKIKNLITTGSTKDSDATYTQWAKNWELTSREEIQFMQMYFDALTKKLEKSKLLKDNADNAQTELEITHEALKRLLKDNALAKEDYSDFLQALYESLENNRELYENIINDTNNDRSWATELDGVQPYSPLTGIEDSELDVQMRDVELESPSPGEQELAGLEDTSLDIKLKDIQLEGTEIPEQDLVKLIDTALDLSLKDVQLEEAKPGTQELAELLSESLALSLKDVQLEGTEIPEQQLAKLLETELTLKLKDITLEGTEVPEQELVKLIDTAIELKLKEIELEGTDVPDQQLAELISDEVVSKLKGIKLEGTEVPEQQLAALVGLAVDTKIKNPGIEGMAVPTQQSASLEEMSVPKQQSASLIENYIPDKMNDPGVESTSAPSQAFASLASNVVAKKITEQVLEAPAVREAIREVKLEGASKMSEMKDAKIEEASPKKEMLIAKIEEVESRVKSIKDAMLEAPEKVTFMKMTELAEDITKTNIELEHAIRDSSYEAKMRDVELEHASDRSIATSLDGGPDKSSISSGAVSQKSSYKASKKIKSGGLLQTDYKRRTEIL